MARKGIFDRLGDLVDQAQTANKKNKKEATADKSLFDRLRGEIKTLKKETPEGEDEVKTTRKVRRKIDKIRRENRNNPDEETAPKSIFDQIKDGLKGKKKTTETTTKIKKRKSEDSDYEDNKEDRGRGRRKGRGRGKGKSKNKEKSMERMEKLRERFQRDKEKLREKYQRDKEKLREKYEREKGKIRSGKWGEEDD